MRFRLLEQRKCLENTANLYSARSFLCPRTRGNKEENNANLNKKGVGLVGEKERGGASGGEGKGWGEWRSGREGGRGVGALDR